MPLARYFLFVGGVLLALLFISDAYLPKLAVSIRAISSFGHHPHSVPIRNGRARRYDTSLPTVIPAQIANMETDLPARQGSVTSSKRWSGSICAAATVDANQLQRSDPKKREPKLQRQRKKIATRQAAPAARLVARQPQFGWLQQHVVRVTASGEEANPRSCKALNEPHPASWYWPAAWYEAWFAELPSLSSWRRILRNPSRAVV